jgi:osmotically-inducible protein OsmY
MERVKNNRELKKDVQDAINFKSLLNAAAIGVSADDGIVTLTGTVDSYARKWRAEDVAKNVAGVKAVVGSIEIKFGNDDDKSDMEIARKVLTALKLNFFVPANELKVVVENGHVTLSGDVHWAFQKEAAQKSAENVTGIKILTDKVIVSAVSPAVLY